MIRTLDRELLERSPFHPRLFGMNGAVASEHYLAANAGADVLKAGGNAVDAAVAAALVEGLVNPHQHTIGGECPMLIQMADRKEPVVVNGNTMAPTAASVDAYRSRGLTEVPDTGILAAGVPAALGSYCAALDNFGTMPFREVCSAALELASNGFAIHRGLVYMTDFGIAAMKETFQRDWPNTAALYLPEGETPKAGDILKNPALADFLQSLVDAERRVGDSRKAGIAAVRQEFYSGIPALEISKHCMERDALLAIEDLNEYKTFLEEPVSVDFHGARVFKCGPWNQGPAMLQALSILQYFDLQAMDHNSTQYLHTVIEAVKLAFADREQWYGDPGYVDVPIDELLSDNYGWHRASLIDTDSADDEIRPGDPRDPRGALAPDERVGGAPWGPGTVHVDAADRHGNMVSATPSGGWIRSSEVVKSLGFPLGNRLMTFYLEPANHPGVIAPRKRPRTTISPTMVHRDGYPWIAYGSMGGDQQDQWMLQFILNRVMFDMTLAQAIEAPKFSSRHFPGYFAPHDFIRKSVNIEPRVGRRTIDELREMGHDVDVVPDWTEGFLLAIERNHETGLLEAACDPRGAKGDVFPAAACCW